MSQVQGALKHSLSLYPAHLEIIEQAADERNLRGNTFSPAVQFIIDDWQRQRDELAALRAEVERLRAGYVPVVDRGGAVVRRESVRVLAPAPLLDGETDKLEEVEA